MKVHIKLRQFILLAIGFSLFLFQACGVMPQDCSPSDKSCAAHSSSTSTSSTSNSSNSSNSNVGLGSAPSVGAGSTGGAGYAPSTGSNTSPGRGGSTGGFSGGGGTSGGPTTQGGPLQITLQPLPQSISMNAALNLVVSFSGGTAPYKYQWFINNVADTTYLGQNYNYSTTAFRYDNEGTYYLQITDASGVSVKTRAVTVSILDPISSCAARSYYTNVTNTGFVEPLATLFTNTRGNYFWPADYEELAPVGLDSLNGSALSFLGLARQAFPAGNFSATTSFACGAADIPKVHARTPNPEWNFDYSYNSYADTTYYKYEGAVTFECRGGKWLFRSNSCQWKYYPPPPDFGGGN